MKPLEEITVRDYMTKQSFVVDDTARLVDAIRLMDDKRVSAVPVVNEQGKLVGVLSNSDLIGMMHEIQADLGALHYVNDKTRDFLIGVLMEQGNNTLVMDVMTTPVEMIPPETKLVVAAEQLCQRKIHHFPVVDARGTSIGILSSTDIVRAVADVGKAAKV